MAPTTWLWTSRAGFERDLADELPRGRVLAPALAASDAPRPGAEPPTFGRQGFPIAAEVKPTVEALAAAVTALVPPTPAAFALQIWVPDSDAANRLSARATELVEGVTANLGARERLVGAHELADPDDPIVQVCLADDARAYVGALPRSRTISTWPGGRARMKVPSGAPSRATSKIAEALSWIGYGPESGDVCVDLGAAPGGWTWLLLRRKARVIAVDRANLQPDIARDRKVMHLRDNAFTFRPDEPVDWLFCDMVWKPMEVARLLAEWGKRHWARYLVSNIKLPMKKRLATVGEVKRTLMLGGWRDVRMRQLYHDRDEITLHARR
ncbi:MAG: 23S rRNA (cytidine(2498)-2'-O)-methyltransferase RlmM [Deltaproteobacteria bacterium]|nr:23S rRNA (cytidine(2498)-2'-O)-methyltransferase RlmM [Deltaproteobacteria bacterium]